MQMIDSFNKRSSVEFIDYSEDPILHQYDLGGVTPKIVVNHCGKPTMLKFAKKKAEYVVRDYVTEFLACRFATELGYSVQEVHLGYYAGLQCVGVVLFDYNVVTFTGFGSSTDDQDFDYDLRSLLMLPFNRSKFALSIEEFEAYVWSVFALDMLVGNFDRHENNWGFRKVGELYEPSALYDMGASFYPRFLNKEDFTDVNVAHLIEFDTRCAILYDGKKKNYFELLRIYKDNTMLQAALQELVSKPVLNKLAEVVACVLRYDPTLTGYCDFVMRVSEYKIGKVESLCR